MHICELVRLMPIHAAGGMQAHAASLSEALVRQGHRVTIMTAELPGKHEEEINGLRVVYVPGARPDRHTSVGWRALNDAWDALHARDPFDLVHAHSSAAEGWVRRRRPQRPPLVVTMHGTHWGEWLTSMRSLGGRPKGQLKSSIYLWWTYFVVAFSYLPRARAMIFVSLTDLRRGRRLYALPRRRELIPNGVDTDLFSPQVEPALLRAELSLDPGVPIVLGAGRIVREKGFGTAVEALAGWPGLPPYLVLVGAGPEVAELQALAHRLRVGERLNLLPAVDRAALPRYLAAADLFVFPTWREEGSPNILIEAMSCARPIVASDLGGVRNLVTDGRTAVLVPPRDSAALRRAMADLLADPGAAARLGQAARVDAVANFGLDRMARATAALFEQVVAKARTP